VKSKIKTKLKEMNRAQMQEIQEHFESETEEIKQVMVTS